MRSRLAALSCASLGTTLFLGPFACGGTTPSEVLAPNATDGGTSSDSPNRAPPGTLPDGAPGGPFTAATCFRGVSGTYSGVDYDKLGPTLTSCAGTHHQTITGVEKVVFLGDSVTVGTPPTKAADFYRSRLEVSLRAKFGASLEIASCAKYGAQIGDLLGGDKQIDTCFPAGVEPKRTLVIMTNGGNDVFEWAKDSLSAANAAPKVDASLESLRAAVTWLKSPEHFPNGSFVVYANAYEYTDTSGDLLSCPAAGFAGVTGAWPEARPTILRFAEGFLKVAVETKSDLVFLLEDFCGHGYRRDDPKLECYRGPNAPLWFDFTCIHPTAEGHGEIASLFTKVIDGQ